MLAALVVAKIIAGFLACLAGSFILIAIAAGFVAAVHGVLHAGEDDDA